MCLEEKEDIMSLTTEGDDAGFCSMVHAEGLPLTSVDHSFCLDCIMGHIEAKQSHGLPAECPLCRRRILGVEKNTTASKLFQLIKKIDQQIDKQPPAENPQPQDQDDPILEAIKEENMKVKRELEGTPLLFLKF